MYQTVPINVAGPSAENRSLPLSAQVSQGYYQEVNEGAKAANVMQPFPGLKPYSLKAGSERGSTVMDEVMYRVADERLYRVDSFANHIDLGEVAGNNRCIFANDGVNLFITTGNKLYQFDGSTVSLVSDSDIQGADSVDYQNRQFIYAKDNTFIVSDVGNGASASALNAAQAESQPDDLNRAYVFKDDVFMVGARSTEPFYNTGVGSPPYDRITGQIVSIGSNAIHSIASNDNYFYMLGDDNIVYQCVQGIFNPISTTAMANAFCSYVTTEDAIGYTLTIEAQKFYLLTFPQANKTWLLNETLGRNGWTQLSSDTNGGAYQGTSAVRVYGKTLVSDDQGVHELDLNTYDNSGEIIQRIRTFGDLHGGLVGKPGARLQMSKLTLILHTGGGLTNGQGEDPRVMVEASTDGGRSYGPGTWARIGRQGENIIKAEWHSSKTFYDLIVRVTITDPVYCALFSGSIDVRFAGW